ncbi:MAG TPA: purine nucleoside permease [Acidobacteriaceae bacterium]
MPKFFLYKWGMKQPFGLALLACAGFSICVCVCAHAEDQAKITPRVLLIATYETGKDTGDTPGELQLWAEREKLTEAISVPGIEHPLLTNGKGLYAMVSGVTSRSALSLMSLAMNDRFDLTHTYILLSGIGGADPKAATLGSAVWVRSVLDGDPAYEIDSRETPKSWPYGTIALGTTEPGKAPVGSDAPAAGLTEESSGGVGKIVFHLNRPLVDWAYNLTRNVKLGDSPAMKKDREHFSAYPAAAAPPGVIEGDSLGTDHFWHGAIMTRWAEDWVTAYTHGEGKLAISDCEDQGIVLAADRLGQLGRVDPRRLLVLRTASNFTLQAPGVTAERSLFDGLVTSSGYLPALEAAYTTGGVVVHKLLDGWDEYNERVP